MILNNSAEDMLKVFVLTTLLTFLEAVCHAQTVNKAQTISSIPKIEQPIVIDGALDEAGWQDAASVNLNFEHYPDANASPPVETVCLITYDRENLYIAFKASDPAPEAIRAHLMDRDSREKLMRDDHVGITLDPFNNEQWGLQFRVNAMGVQADGIYSNQRNSIDYSLDAIWESDGTITEDGYVIEIQIPFSSINIPAAPIQNWRFSAFRNYPRSVQHRIRSHPINLDEQSLMRQFNQLEGFEDLSSGINLKVNPVFTLQRTNDLITGDGTDEVSHNVKPGGNLQWGIKPNLNLNATINPDFSQIEADALQLQENRRFVLSFPEKRPFFLEDSEIFDTPLNAVFTRSIIEPNGGLKMTGKMGDHSLGTFITQDQSSRVLFPANQQSKSKILDERTYSEIVRYRNQISSNAAIGVLGEARQSGSSDYENYVGGLDGYLQFLESNTFQVQYLHSNTDYTADIANEFDEPSERFGGSALYLNLDHRSRNWVGQAGYTSFSSGFRNDNGFFPRADFQTFQTAGQRIFRGSSDSWFNSIRFGPAFELTTDQSGTLTDQSILFAANYRGPLQSEVSIQHSIAKQRFNDQLFSGLDTGVFFFRVQPANFLSKFRIYTAYGETVDYTNTRKANELIIHPGLTFDINRSLNIEVDPNYQRLSHNGTRTFSTYLLGTRMMYHFNKQTFVRSIFQYRYVDRNLNTYNNPDLFDSSTRSFFYQLLFSYKINPQSKLFLGYSSGYGAVNEHPLKIQSKTGYLKVGYSWVF